MIASAARVADGREVVAPEEPPRVGERRDRQPVPGGERLVVAGGLRPGGPSLEELRPRCRETRFEGGVRARRRRGVRVRPDAREDRRPLPVPEVGDAVCGEERRGVVAQHLADLGRGPGERQPLDAIRVGVLAGRERAVGRRELADQVVEHALGDLAEARVTGLRPRVQVDPRELRVVVEHLLEVRDEPDRVGRVPVEAAAQLVVDAAVGHLLEVEAGDRLGLGVAAGHPAEQELDGHRLRELRGAAPAAVDPVEAAVDPGRGLVEERTRRVVGGRAGVDALLLHERRDQPRPRRFELVALLAPGARDALEHLAEGRHPVARLVRVVGAAVERPAVGRQEDRHRPAALPGHRLDGAHVQLVEVGALLAVHLDRHEVVVHVGRGRRVLERLALHDVAPVAGGVADREEDRPIEQLRAGERVAAPREPVDRVVGVLEQVGARLAGEAVRHGPSVAHAVRSRSGVRAHRRWGQNRQIGTDLGNGSMVFVRRTEVRSLPATERWRLFAEVAVES